MTNHTGTVRVCQYHAHNPRLESTPPPSSPSPDSIDRRLVQRYGVALLTGGYTALPTYAWVYYARLGVSEAEMVLIAQLCTYWWSAHAPYPGEASLAARMGKTVRTIQSYLRSLEAKGLLHIHTQFSTNGRQSTNAYDLRPFVAGVEGLARLDGLLPADDATPATPATKTRDNDSCNVGPCDHTNRAQRTAEREPLCAEATSVGTDNRPTDAGTPTMGEGEGSRGGRVKDPSPQVNPIEIENFDFDSIPPTPTKTTQTPTDAEARRPPSADPNDQALTAVIADLSAALGDDAPRSSLGRARNLCRDAGVSPARFLRLLDEAAARTRDRQASIVKRQRDGQAPNGMPYLFAVLADLLHPTPPRTADVGPATDRRRAGPSGRRRRQRAGGRSEPVTSYAAWSDSPARLPIAEEHPVWRAVLAELAQVLTPENFNTWLASTRAVDQEGEVLRVAVPTPFNKTWLEQKLHGKVTGALHKIDDTLAIGRVGRVEYVVDPAACARIEAAAQAS
jgi:hypothetical protein